MPLIGFDQDPAAPQGMGTFHFDDGRSLYAHDPETAAQMDKQPQQMQQPSPELMAAAAPGPDQRTAMLGGQSPTEQRLAGGGAPPELAGLPPTRALNNPPPPPEAAGPPSPPGPQPNAPPDQQQAISNYVNRPVVTGPTKGGYRPAKESQTVEQEGLPYDEEDVKARQDANNDLQIAKKNTMITQATRAQAEALHAQEQIPELRTKAAEAQKKVYEQEVGYKNDRADLDQFMAANQANQKSFNASRLFTQNGGVGGIGAILAQAMGVYGAQMRGGNGKNWAQEAINKIQDSDIKTQEMQIQAGKGDVDNALQRLKLRYGDMDQAKAALKIAMTNQTDAMALSYAKSTGAQDIINAWQEQTMQNQKDNVTHEQAFKAAAIGKRKTETSGAIVAPSAGGSRERTDEEKLKALAVVQKGQEVGALPDTSREGRALDMKQKADEAKKKSNPAVAKTQEQLDAADNALRNAAELDALYAKPGILSRAERGRMESLQAIAPLEVHKALTGMSRFTETEGQRYATAYGHEGETLDYTGKHRAALGVLREDLARKKAQLQKQLDSGVGSAPDEAVKDVE